MNEYKELLEWLRNDGCSNDTDCEHCPDSTQCTLFIMNRAADAIEELSRLHEAQRQNLIALMNEDTEMEWISVTERLPKESERVLVACEDGVSFGFFEEIIADDEFVKEWHDMMYYPISVTHWMPLPEPPKESEE